jgi:NhaP-type Na+/H+ or K+/H+ antiporter
MEIGFAEALTIVGLLLVGVAAVSGVVQRTVLSIAVLSVVAGAVLELSGVVSVDAGSAAVVPIVELVLLVTLFSDGLLVEQELLRRHWGPPARALVLAMPLNATVLAVVAKVLFGELSWAEAFLLGFILSPTDPVVTSSVVASARVPARVRHTLNVESGLNDGLALPFVLLFLELSAGEAQSVAGAAGGLALESLIGLLVGVALAWGAGAGLGRLPDWAITSRYEGLYALGLGLAAFGVAELVHGNGLIAAFCAGIALTLVRRELPDVFHELNENVSSILQVVAFAVFGALVIDTGLETDALPVVLFAVLVLFVVRPASVMLSFLGVRLDRPEKLFVAWFGPKGIASMLFALFVLNSTAPDRTLVFDVAALTILASILAHGLTDTVGARWIERRVKGSDG